MKNKDSIIVIEKKYLFRQVDYMVWSMLICGFAIGFLTAFLYK